MNDRRVRQGQVWHFAADFPGIQAEIFTINAVRIDKINSRIADDQGGHRRRYIAKGRPVDMTIAKCGRNFSPFSGLAVNAHGPIASLGRSG